MKNAAMAALNGLGIIIMILAGHACAQAEVSGYEEIPSFDTLYSFMEYHEEQDHYASNPAAPFHSTTMQEYAPVQKVATSFPNGQEWYMDVAPSTFTYKVNFSGTPGNSASHEGMDFVHNKSSVPHVDVVAVSQGTVAYVRTGCPQSSMFSHNNSLREAGAGWGNHVVIHHGNGIYTRYAHLAPKSIAVQVGDQVEAGDYLAEMGNTGRSETRHLHFEVGYKKTWFNASKPAQCFDRVLNPAKYLP